MILEFVPAHFKVIEQTREKIACPACESGVQIAESQKVMERGRPGPGLLAHILVSKHADALPLYRRRTRSTSAATSSVASPMAASRSTTARPSGRSAG